MSERRRSLCWLWLAIVGIGAWMHAHAAERDRARPLDLAQVAAPAFTAFTSRDGLPDTVTMDTATDRDGFVWAATPIGPYRYDGRRWQARGGEAMRHFVDDLHVDRQGTLWAALRSAGIARYDGSRWHVQDRDSGLPSQQVRRIGEAQDDDGRPVLWALTWDAGALQYRGGRWVADRDSATLPRDPVFAIAQTPSLGGMRRTWLGLGNQGLWYRDAGTRGWRRWQAPGFDAGQVEYLLATGRGADEALWISAFGSGLWRLDANGLKRWSRSGGELPSDDLYGIATTRGDDGSETVWAASRSGLVRVHGEDAQVFDRRHGLPADAVRGLGTWSAPDGSQVLWLATEAGMARTIPGASAWVTASLLGARSIGVFAVLMEPDGRGGERLWVGGAGDEGLGLYQQGRWRSFGAATGELPPGGISAIVATTARDGARTRWIGSWTGELLRLREDAGAPTFERVDRPWPTMLGNAVQDVLARDVGGTSELWVGTRQSGAWRRRDGVWTQPRPAGVDGPWRVTRFQAQRDGDDRHWLWASTDHGLARFDGERWTLFGREAGLSTLQLIGMRLYHQPDGRSLLWVGSADAGVVRVDITDPRKPVVLPADLPPPPDPTVYSALRDSAGRIYVCTNNGVQKLIPMPGGWRQQVYTRRHGMVHDECNTNAQFIDRHDRFWTGTLGGLTVYDPAQDARDTQPKPLRIVGLRVDGTPVPGPGIEVPADARSVEIDYALLSWQREGESLFRSQLLGYESEPGPWGAQGTRSFGALPPGDYRLRIEARDYAGNRSVPVELPLSVRAHWWRTGWAQLLGVAALLLLGYAVALLRTRALRARQRELEQRVAARTAALNDANARLVDLSYRDALTGLANRRRLLESLDERVRSGASAALVFVDVDHFKAFNDLHGHPAGDEALRGVAAALLACAPADALVARYGGEEFACLLPRADIPAAVAFAECCRAGVAARDIHLPGTGQTQRVTISAGVAGTRLVLEEDAHRLLREADLALYRAKRDGRNRVHVHAGDAPGGVAS